MIIPAGIRRCVELYVEELWRLDLDSIAIYLDKRGVCVGCYKGSYGHRQYFEGFEFVRVTEENAKEFAERFASIAAFRLKQFEEGGENDER